MGKLVTANVATNLYWLGRNLERTETTLYKIVKAYDEIIDVDKDAGIELYKKFDIELEYANAKDFLHVAIQGEHAANILDLMTNARESAIISRHRIDTEAFGEIIELHALFKDAAEDDIDYKLIDKALSLISEIWGALSKREHTNNAYLFFRMGKLVEEADLRIRFNKDEAVTLSVIEEIDSIVLMLQEDDETSTQSQSQSNEEVDLLSEVNTKINKIIVE
ncbi:MAG: alpha-E domain-containing protein [Campylobacterota bacterium]|nr:alpha-E domain-containing protein [Campylobacterota bacterium]